MKTKFLIAFMVLGTVLLTSMKVRTVNDGLQIVDHGFVSLKDSIPISSNSVELVCVGNWCCTDTYCCQKNCQLGNCCFEIGSVALTIAMNESPIEVTESASSSYQYEIQEVIQLSADFEDSREIIMQGGPTAVFAAPDRPFRLANCRVGPTQILEIAGEEVYYNKITCDKICGYFYCGTITF